MQPTTPFDILLGQTLTYACRYLNNLHDQPVAATATLTDLRNRLSHPLTCEGIDAFRVIEDLVADTAGGLIGSAGGRFFGWAIGGTLPAALAADWLTSTWNQNSTLFATSPAVAVIEEVCSQWLKELLGLPPAASFAFVTGCQMAHVTCLAAARNALLARCGWAVEEQGLSGSPPLRILSGNQRHGSIDRAVRLLGFGRNSVVDLPVDENGRLQAGTLRAALEEQPGRPTIVLLQAGDLNTGAFDPFAELIPIAHEHKAWVHVDGAFGLWTAASPKYRHLVAGMEYADSWATDGHKWLNVPFDSGYAFTAHPEAHSAAMSLRASYLTHSETARDSLDWTPEWSRRGRGVATYAAIRHLGRHGIAALIERTCSYAHALVSRIAALPGVEMVREPTINQGVVRFLDLRSDATETDHNDYTDRVIAEILKAGEAFFTGTTLQGKRCMRVSVMNWQTDETDIDRAVASIERILQGRSRC